MVVVVIWKSEVTIWASWGEREWEEVGDFEVKDKKKRRKEDDVAKTGPHVYFLIKE